MHVFLLPPPARPPTTSKPCLAQHSMRFSLYSTAISLFLHSGLSYPCKFYCCLRYAVAACVLCFSTTGSAFRTFEPLTVTVTYWQFHFQTQGIFFRKIACKHASGTSLLEFDKHHKVCSVVTACCGCVFLFGLYLTCTFYTLHASPRFRGRQVTPLLQRCRATSSSNRAWASYSYVVSQTFFPSFFQVLTVHVCSLTSACVTSTCLSPSLALSMLFSRPHFSVGVIALRALDVFLLAVLAHAGPAFSHRFCFCHTSLTIFASCLLHYLRLGRVKLQTLRAVLC